MPEERKRTCGTMPVHERLLRTNPEYARARTESENRAFEYRTGRRKLARAGVTVLPVVVHVVWNKNHAEQNISDAQIQSQIVVLNQDFRKLNPDVSGTPANFRPLSADARIEFQLADKDPGGNSTNGITRTQTNSTGFSDDDMVKSAATGGADPWPADKYLNLWVCPLSGGLLGYAQFPGGPAATDGVVILHSAFGSTGTAAAPFDKGRTASHEIGHWLNLRHIWGDDGAGCNGSDFVDDTPNQGGPNYGMPAFPHVTCNNGPDGDMFMNYMDYVDDAAMFMFTEGQVIRMQATLDNERSNIGTTVDGQGGWQGPQPFGDPHLVPGAAVALFQQSPTVFTALTVDKNGAMNVAWLDLSNPIGWQGPQPFGDPHLVPGAAIALFQQSPTVFTALTVDKNGAMNAAWLDLTNPAGRKGDARSTMRVAAPYGEPASEEGAAAGWTSGWKGDARSTMRVAAPYGGSGASFSPTTRS
jgi:hypothetical protein